LEDGDSRSALAKKKFAKTISAKKAGHGGVHMLIPATGESINRRIKFQTSQDNTPELISKINRAQKAGGTLQSPELKS
jgi:hypothetical protein